MIKLNNVTKQYGNRLVLKCLNYQFPNKGLCIIYGPSGSGKTTLLNCIAGLLSFNGSIEVGHQYLERMNDDELSKLRLSEYGFIFQDFKLFENETVIANLLFPLETLYRLSKTKKMRKCQDLLLLVGLDNKEKQIVNKLSGGEKQRVAIARALINDPKVLLADEPTGALDEKNGVEIMNILKKISKNSLVILVSHDEDLTREYADHVITMDEGEIVAIDSFTHKDKNKSNLPVVKNGYVNKKAHIPDSFLFSHTYHSLKQKKGRTVICYSMTSLGLIGVGLAFALSSTIAINIKQAYREVIDENSIMVSSKDESGGIKGQYASSYYEAESIKAKYGDYISDIGVTYLCNFEKFFKDINNLTLVNNYRYCPIEGFSARHINEFIWLDDLQDEIYPEPIEHLEDDEVVLSLDYPTLRNLCFDLQIERSVQSLSNYISEHAVYLYFDLENDDWSYTDQQIVSLKGFILDTSLNIYHSNHMWNEYMFETRMRFPTSDALSSVDKEPWVMKKIYYLKASENRNALINLLLEDKECDDFIFEIANETYYPWLYYEKEMKDRDRLLIFMNTISHIPTWQIPYFLSCDTNLKEPVIGNQGGYLIYPESLMMGFAKTMYFSFDESKLEEIIDYQTSRSSDAFYKEDLPDGVISGNYAKSLQNGVKYEVFDGELQLGNAPTSLNEIVVSDTFINSLGIKNINEPLYVATAKNEVLTVDNKIISDYVLIPLTITGVKHSSKNVIYHQKNWTTLFYQCEVGISVFSLQNTTLSFSLKDPNLINESVSKLKTAFPNYQIINPLSDVNESVDTVCFYISIVLIIFSSVATLISILLLTICNYLYIIEGRKEIALARCLGVNKKESRKFLHYHSLVQCLVSFMIASVELFVVSIVANMQVGRTLSLGFTLSFDPLSLIPMLVLAVLIALISSLSMSKKINKINPLEALKR